MEWEASLFSPLATCRFALFKSGRRPELLQNMLDLRKRLRGPPKGPRVTIVVTDIEDFSSECLLMCSLGSLIGEMDGCWTVMTPSPPCLRSDVQGA